MGDKRCSSTTVVCPFRAAYLVVEVIGVMIVRYMAAVPAGCTTIP